jgi:hypothetical protein
MSISEPQFSQGAVQQSWRSGARHHLLEILRHAEDEEEARRLLWKEFEECETLRREILNYWIHNHLHYLRRDYRAEYLRKKGALAAAADNSTVVDKLRSKIIENVRNIIFLDLVLPNGKTLRNTTGTECEALAPVLGGWLMRIGIKAGRKEVGKVMSEEDVKALWAASR